MSLRSCFRCRVVWGYGWSYRVAGSETGHSDMRILVACEFSGTVRDAFAALGHDAWSCDILPTEKPGNHYQGDVREFLGLGWDLMVAHPPCTYLSRAGARWWGSEERQALGWDAAAFVAQLYHCDIPMVAIENPIGKLNRLWRYPDQTIQPYDFGHPYSKATCLWLKNLPPLMATEIHARHTPFLPSNTGKGKRAGQKSSPGVAKNAHDASRTFPGIAAAMANQWGGDIRAKQAA